MEKLQCVMGSDNIFRDLGFAETEAKTLLLRCDLVIRVHKAIDQLGVTPAEAAKRAGITQARLNDLLKNRTAKFTLAALMDVAKHLGCRLAAQLRKQLTPEMCHAHD